MDKKIVNIDFNSVIKKIILPPDFNSFLEKIQKILNIKPDLISCFEFKYNSEYGEIYMNSDDAYENFIDDINSETTITIIYSNQNPDLDMDSCTKSFENFNENINNDDIINDDSDNNIDNNINIVNDINDSNNESMDNSNMNIITKKEDYISLLNKNINENEKENSNINNETINNNVNINFSEIYIIFFELCSSCYKYPLENAIYYCLECKIYICEECERQSGFNHRHTLLKIQTKEQYNDLMYNKSTERSPNQSKLKQIYYYLKNYTYIFFSRKRFPELMNKIQIFREKYNSLKNIKDIELKNALTEAKGDFDKAFEILKNDNL